MDCHWKSYIDIERFFSKDITLCAHFCTVDHVIGNLNLVENSIVMDLTGETLLIGREIRSVGREFHPAFSKNVIADHNKVLERRKPLQFYHSHTIKNKYQVDFSIFKMPIYSRSGKLEGVFGFATCPWKFSIERAVNNELTKREVECLFLFLKKNSTKRIAKLLNLQVRTVEAYFEEIKAKLKCYNRMNLIEEAYKLKILESQDILSSCDLLPNSYHSLFKNNIMLTKSF